MSTRVLPGVMREMPIFAGLSDREVALLSLVLKEEFYGPDERLLTEGEAGDSCFFLVSGEVDVVKSVNTDHEAVLTTIIAPEMVGQVALVDDGPRTASCVARTTVRALRLSRRDFQTLFQSASTFARHFQAIIGAGVARQLAEAHEELRMVCEEGVRDT